jgi:hypothetical protein
VCRHRVLAGPAPLLAAADPVFVSFCRGSDLNNFGAAPQQKKLQAELSDLSAMEDALDELIKDCAQQLLELTDDKENERYPSISTFLRVSASRVDSVLGRA